METEQVPQPKRGIALMVVLGVVVFFTMLGFMGLEMATKDSQVSGTLLDIKSKESAAWGGLNLALGVMQANPANTVTQLQNFIADSSVAVASKRQWFGFGGGVFALLPSDTGFFPIGSGGDKSGIKVRIISMDINGATGNNDGSGVPITLECTGQGRNGQQLKIIASYRILGIDIPVQTTTVAGGAPSYALYLNGNLSNSNVGTTVTGNVYIGGAFAGNSAGPQVINGNLKVNGSYTSNATLTVNGETWIGGDIVSNAGAPMWFKGSLGLGGSFGSLGSNVTVDKYMNVYGPTPTTHNWGTMTLKVGKQLYVAQDPQTIPVPLVVGTAASSGDAYFGAGFNLTGTATIYGNLMAASSAAQPSTIGSAVTVGGSLGILDKGTGAGQFKITGATAKLTVTGNGRIDGDVNEATSGATAPILSIGGNAEFNGAISEICQVSSNAISVTGKTFMQGNATVPIQTNMASGCRTNGGGGGVSLGNDLTLTGTIAGSFGQKYTAATVNKWSFAAAAPSKIWSYYANGGTCGGSPGTGTGYSSTPTSSTSAGVAGTFPFYGGDAPRVGGAATSNGGACNSSALVLGTHYVPGYGATFTSTFPTRLTDPAGLAAMSTLDTLGSQANNPPDTVYVDSIHSPGAYAKMHTLTSAIQTAAGITGSFGNISDVGFFNKLYTYFASQSWLYNGYMVVRVASSQAVNLGTGTGFAAFTGKALWIMDGTGVSWYAVDAKGLWPASATATNIQVIHVMNGMKFQNFGIATSTGGVGTMYGFVYYGTDLSAKGWYIAANNDVGGSTTNGTMEGSIEVAHSLAISTWVGKYTINQNAAVFTDITTNLPGVLHVSGSSGGGSGSSSTTSTKTLTVRAPAAGIQFVRIGEFR